MAGKFDKGHLDFETQCTDKDLTGAVLRELVQHGKKHKLEKFEIPGAVTIVKELWEPDTGLVTAAFKLKRRPLQVRFRSVTLFADLIHLCFLGLLPRGHQSNVRSNYLIK